jgi:hypothetical protein
MRKGIVIPWAVVLVTIAVSPVSGAIVYSGSQNVALSLSPMSPMDSKIIQLGGMPEDWDDFTVNLWFDMGMSGMAGMGMMDMGAGLTIGAPGMDGGKGTPLGGILGLQGLASNLPAGATIGADSFFDVWLEITPPDGSGEFGEEGGYLGLRTALGQFGWLHILSQSKIGTENHSVVFDGWAYEDVPGVPIGAGQGKTCDWVPGQPHKMHWPQLPDLGTTGIDISLAHTSLADDFKCTATGPITDIHIWGSFRNDGLPSGGPGSLTLQLSIYSDIPATTIQPSRPGNLLWARTFKPGEYSARKVHDGPEDWYDPVTNQYLPANHRQAFQYNFCINHDAFEQEEGTVYWLVVDDLTTPAAATAAGPMFGWKTTAPQYHWNDDSAYQDSTGTGWRAMTYPKGHRYEGRTLDLAFVITGGGPLFGSDLGDAPDSTNSFPGVSMSAYPGVNGHFPTVYQAGSPPYGPLHRHPRDVFFLGKRVTLEAEADMGFDEDGVNNLDPVNNAADRDGADDGLHQPVVYVAATGDGKTTVEYDVTCTSSVPIQAYVNIWFDFNRDGDWDDLLSAPDGAMEPEWAVQNQLVSLPAPGEYTFTSPPFVCAHLIQADAAPLWVRITIAEKEHLPSILIPGAAPGIDGAGPAEGYKCGETEDYLIRPLIEATPLKYDWGDAPETAAAAGYPTLLASNGARHVPVGPWLGDANDRPDSEPDGQPDPLAQGDDMQAKDDENGVSIPPLVPGQLAVATIEVNGGGGRVQGWIDFNRDRVWQDAECVFDGFLPDGQHLVPFSVPSTAVAGQSFARFRISRNGGLAPVGPAPDGEVEDHEVSIGASVKDEGDSGKTWCQRPDLTPQGIDICLNQGPLADDFGCKASGLLTHIRLWGSWKDDRKGQIKKIRVTICPDDPVGPPGADPSHKFSKPGPETLWAGEFVPGRFQETLYHTVVKPGEWWWYPGSDKASPGGDTQVWQIDMDVESANAFKQEGTATNPQIYWLVVEVDTAEGEFGWKTRQWPEHFMDDAVWKAAVGWDELHYPFGHPYSDSERNSIDLAFCLKFSTPTPPPTILPGTVTACPAVETTCPAIETKCPPVETKCPSVDTKCPPLETRCPPVATQCPPAVTTCPGAITECPPTETKCPVAATKCPAVETKCPPLETQCPPAETKCPQVVTTCPGAITECPAMPTKCPVTETKCPVVQTKCPPVSTNCPESVTNCPPVPTKCPATQTQCPEESTKCPPVETKCPAVETKCPSVSTQCPPAPTKCPVVQTQCPEESTKCPPVETKCPPVETKCPPVSTQCPPVETKCPPTVPTKCPVALTQCPEESTKCPPAETKCPPAETACPPVSTQCPSVETKCPPTVPTKCPPAETKCPEEQTKCPAVETRCPPTPTKCRTDLTVCPSVETQCPPVETKCPATDTQCPPRSTYCPPVGTECPASPTKCPSVQTQCPSTKTVCSTGCGGGALSAPADNVGVLAMLCPVVDTPCPTIGEYLVMAKARP